MTEAFTILLPLLVLAAVSAWIVLRPGDGSAIAAEDLQGYRHCSLNACVSDQVAYLAGKDRVLDSEETDGDGS